MLDQINTYSHPDVTPAQVLLKRNSTLSSRDITSAQVLRKRNNSLSSSLERLSNGRLSSTSFINSNTINGKDPRIMPPPRKSVIRKSILMGRPSAINAATSAVHPRSLWSKTTEAITQGRIPCPPTPPDSLASSSGSDKTTARELPPRQQKQHKHKQQEHTLAWHPLPILVGTEEHSSDQNKPNTITATAPALKEEAQTFSIPPPPLRTRFILPPSSSEIIGNPFFFKRSELHLIYRKGFFLHNYHYVKVSPYNINYSKQRRVTKIFGVVRWRLLFFFFIIITVDLAKQTIDWQSPFHSFVSMVLCLTILSTFNQAENNNNSLFYFIIMNAFKMTGLSLLIIFLCENIIKCKILTTDLIQ